MKTEDADGKATVGLINMEFKGEEEREEDEGKD